MNYQTFEPHPDLGSIISCYWTLEVPKTEETQRQRIIPDGTIEMAFILGDDIKRYTSEDRFIIQPRAMVLGHTTDPFYIEPTGSVNTFAIRFYPYGFAHFVHAPIKALANTETPLVELFEEKEVRKLEQDIIHAADAQQRIEIIESFLLSKLNEKATLDSVVKSTIETLFETKGSTSISKILNDDLSKRRQLERKFVKQIGVSPKQLGKLIRLQSALKVMLNEDESLTDVAYQNDYYDQSHFIKDFKEFTGVSPKEFLGNENMALSSIFYK
ncbi:helix-turn-helix domain-containing protein [Vibrio sp. 10N.261.55.A7]|uniref:helix-turn-helix domain-containing protein n=1 Tax=Vibrio sp. 10N.261.55.A7 TaxID=1880851 RepID=UPI000C81AE74|nr:helix-turn-helix domain-containing protein [Vibrio sp. 10N.261.55.A7]PMJ99494.1 AraC family transcriptional regulator [Vibrio sp. 10N.261.55.A7]